MKSNGEYKAANCIWNIWGHFLFFFNDKHPADAVLVLRPCWVLGCITVGEGSEKKIHCDNNLSKV